MRLTFPFFSLVLFLTALPDLNHLPNFNYSNENTNSSLIQLSSAPSAGLENKNLTKNYSVDKNPGMIDPDWYKETIEKINSKEYYITYNEDLKSYQSPNRANNIRFIYRNDGFTAVTRGNKIPLFDVSNRALSPEDRKYQTITEWSIRFTTSNVRRLASEMNAECLKLPGGDLKIDKNTAAIENEDIRIDYVNDEKGMRQDFTIKNRPGGEGDLCLSLSAETKLEMKMKPNELAFSDNNGSEQMKYSGLKAWDANGKILKASFEENTFESNEIEELKSDNRNIKLFCIVVNDEDAFYPVTIDPLSNSPNWTSESNQADAGFGKSVSTAGDVNGDGYDDVIIGAPFYDNGEIDEGKAFLYLGSPIGLLPIAIWTAESNQASAQFGWSVSTAGDVNGDGFDDIIIGANQFDNDQMDEGKAYVYYGSILGPSLLPNWTVEGNQSGSQFGWTVTGAGDVNNDGYSDVLIGAPLYDDAMTDQGRVFLYEGSPSGLSSLSSWNAESDQASSYFGISVSSAGDVNGDGYTDIVVGANRYDNPLMDEGCAFIYYGSGSGLSNSVSWKSESHALAYFAYLGISVSGAGDVNGDGYDDVIVGSYAYSNLQAGEGKVFVYYGSPTGLSQDADWTAESDQTNARFGYSVSSAGDVNGDGYSDVIVGAREYDDGEIDEGAAFIYFGSAAGLTSLSWMGECNQTGALLGCSVAGAGDVNGDGYSDVIAGAYLYDNGQSNEGSAFVYHGSTSGSKVLSLTTFIQGFYNENSNTMKRDTVTVYFRKTVSPYAVVSSASVYLSTSGTGIYSFPNLFNGVNYYLQIKHRNSIETWGYAVQKFVNNSLSYNFSTSQSKAFGNNMIQVDATPVTFAIYGGDVNQNGTIDGSDLSIIDNGVLHFVTGYTLTDLTGDNITDARDMTIAENNALNFVSVIRP